MCLSPGYLSSFHIDHIIARQHGGETNEDNLALACIHCNRHKGPNIAGRDPEADTIIPLFHPRRDRWADHFERGPDLIGKTPTGRATVQVLAIDDPSFRAVRQALREEGVVEWD